MPSTSNTYDEFASQYAQMMTAQERTGVEPGSNIARFLQITDYFAASGQAVPYRGLAEAGVQVHLYHRTLEDYLAASISAGFQLQHLVDVPTPPGSFKRRNDMVLPEGYHFPFFTILGLVKV